MLKLVLVTTTLLAVAGQLAAQVPPSPPPNLLVIVPDDLGTDAVGCYGSASAPPTPTLDAIAAAGLRFTNFFVNPACTPTRSAVLTGRYAFRTDTTMAISSASVPGMAADAVTIAEPLSIAGYQTAMIGKWHLGTRAGLQTPNVFGFDHFEGVLGSGVPDPYYWDKVTNGAQAPCSTYIMTQQVDAAIQWIQAQTGPWALILTPTLPHQPFHAPPVHLHTQSLAGLSPQTTPLPFFRAMVQAMDTEIARLLVTLGPTVLANTNVVVLPDNGTDPAVVQAPIPTNRAKGSLFDGGCRVPLLISGPSVTAAPGSVATEMVSGVDLFPTLLAMCGAGSYPPPALAAVAQPLDGVSFLPALSGQSGYGRPFVYSEITGTGFGGGYTVRTPTHRLVRYLIIAPMHQELYEHPTDPLETSDLLTQPLSAPARTVFDDLMTKVTTVRDDGWAEVYGTGCGGSMGVPKLRTQQQARVGQWFATRIETDLPNPWVMFTAVGLSRTSSFGLPLPFALDVFGMPGCTLEVSTDMFLLHNAGGYGPAWLLPNDPTIYGLEIFVQGAVGEIGVNAMGLTCTRGLRCVTGR